jgi:transcriptional regulator with XRE-family HTH domain
MESNRKQARPHGALSAMTGDELRVARLTLGFRQETLAQIIGVRQNQISRKEQGHQGITQAQGLAIRGLLLEAACRGRGMKPDEIIAAYLARPA